MTNWYDNAVNAVKTALEAIYVKKTDIKDNLTSTDTNKPLSAKQGKELKTLVDGKVDKETGKGLFSGSYNDLTNKPSSFTPSSHNQATTTITNSETYSNLGSNLTSQKLINDAINTQIGTLKSIKALEVVTSLPTASASTMNKLYVISENSKVNVYYTTVSGSTYSWHKMDTDILDELSIAWNDITGKPSSFTPSSHTHTKSQITDFPTSMTPTSHTHGNIDNSGILKISGTAQATKNVVTDSSGKITTENKPTIPTGSSTATDIKMNGTQSAGGSSNFAKADHVHPVDTSRVAVAQGSGNANKSLCTDSSGNVTVEAKNNHTHSYVATSQGTGNSGKFLKVNSSGNVTCESVTIPSAYTHPSTKQCNYSVSLSNYYTKTEIDNLIGSAITYINQ